MTQSRQTLLSKVEEVKEWSSSVRCSVSAQSIPPWILLIALDAAGVLSEAWATVEDSDELDNFRPHIVHKPHDPFPIAMCNRKPHGCE